MDAPRRALVVIDVQQEYFECGGLRIAWPPVQQSLPNIVRAIDAAHAAGIPVVVVQQDAPATSPIFAHGSAGWQLHPEIAARAHDHLIVKAKPSVFAGTDFADWIAQHQVGTLALVGYMTHNCVASTAFEAAHRGLAVEFLSDATGSLPYANAAGSASAEEIHRVFSVVLHSRFAAVASTADWLAAVASGTPLAGGNILASARAGREAAGVKA